MALTILAAYDVRDNSRRARVAAALQRWGTRIQMSVFICMVDNDGLEALMETVRRIIDPEKDSFMVMRQCAQCWDDLVVIGPSKPVENVLYWAVM
jgi:CRISPR-associated protein Cas2